MMMSKCEYQKIKIDPSDNSKYGIVEINSYEFRYERGALSDLKDENYTVRGVFFPESFNLDDEPLIRYLVQYKNTSSLSYDGDRSKLLLDAIRPESVKRFNKQLLEDILKNCYNQLDDFLKDLKQIENETEIANELANVLKSLISAEIQNPKFKLADHFELLNDLIPGDINYNSSLEEAAESAKKAADSWNVHDFVFQAFRDNAKQQCQDFLTINYELPWKDLPKQFENFKWMKAFIKLINNDEYWNEFSKRIFEIINVTLPNKDYTIGQNVDYYLAKIK